MLFVERGIYFPIHVLAAPRVASDQKDCARASGDTSLRETATHVICVKAVDPALRRVVVNHIELIGERAGERIVVNTIPAEIICAVMVADEYPPLDLR